MFIYTTASLSSHLLMDTDCFHVLATVNNAAMNTGVHVPFRIGDLVSSDIYPEVELLDYMVVLFLVF